MLLREEKSSNVAAYYYLAGLYLAFVSIIAWLIRGDLFYLFPTLLVLPIVVVRRFRERIELLSALSLMALYIWYSSIDFILFIICIPLTLIIPFLFSSLELAIRVEESFIFIGSNASRILRFLVLLSLPATINPKILLSIALLALVTILYSIFEYIKLGGVSVELLKIPKKIRAGSQLLLSFIVRSSSRVLVLIYSNEFERLFSIEGEQSINVALTRKRIGRYIDVIKVFAIDTRGFAQRFIATYSLDYSVVPATTIIAEEARRLISRSGFGGNGGGLEVFVTEIGRKEVKVEKEKPRKKTDRYFLEVLFFELLAHLEKLGVFRRYKEDVSLAKRSRIGEYIGTRYYIPGDRLRDLHWKKTISRRILIVKEYGEALASFGALYKSGSRESGPIIIVDFFATNVRELDSIASKLIRLLRHMAIKSPRIQAVLVVVLGSKILVLEGDAVSLLAGIIQPIEKALKRVFYEYESTGVLLPFELLDEIINTDIKPRALIPLISLNMDFAIKIHSLLISRESPHLNRLIILHGRATVLKYSILGYYFQNQGYSVEYYSSPKADTSLA